MKPINLKPSSWQQFLKSLKKREVAALPLGKKPTIQPEVLENRIAPASLASLSSGSITVSGDQGAAGEVETLVFTIVSGDLYITDATHSITAGSGFTQNGGNEVYIALSSLTDDFTVNTGTGSDTVTFSDALSLPGHADITSGGTVTFGNTLTLAATKNLTVSSSGLISASGALTVPGTATFAAGSANDITLGAANDFSTVLITSGNNVSVTDSNALVLGASTVSGTLGVTTSGALTQSGVLSVTGAATLAVGSGNNLTLANPANTFSTVTITSANNVSLADADGLILGTSTVSGTLDVATSGAITQSGVVTVTGATTLAAGSGNNITLNSANDFSTLAITSGNNVSVTDSNALVLGASTVSGTLGVTTSGAITQSGALTVTGTATFAAGSGNNITLNSANDFSTFAVTSGNSVAVTDADALILGASAVSGTLAVTTSGALTQSGAVAVTSTSALDSGEALITLTNVGNNFGGAVALTNSAANNVSLVNSVALSIATSSVGTGTLSLTGAGISQTGTITQAASAGAVTLTGGSAAISLALGNDFTGAVTASTSGAGAAITINDATGGLDAVSVTTTDGAITLSATSGDLTATTVTAGGSSRNVSLTTTTSGNVLVDSVTASGDTVTISSAESIEESGADVGADVTASTLSLTAATGIGAAEVIETALSNLSATSTNGGIDLVNAGALSITSLAASTSGNITLTNTGSIALAGNVSAASGTVSFTTNVNITRSAGTVSGTTVTLSATSGSIGASGAAVNTAATALDIASSGDQFITEANGANVTSTATAGNITLTTTTGDWTLVTTGVAASGTVSITATAGDILRSGAGAEVTGTTLTFTAGGADGDLGASGNALLTSGTAIVFTGTGTGDVFITESDGATITGATGSGAVTLTTTLGDWTINSTGVDTTGNVTITASAGDILRSGGTADITGNTLTLNADGNLGDSGNALLTSGTTIVFAATGAGEVNITEANGANVRGSTGSGEITLISTTGSWTVNSTGVGTTGGVNITATAGDILRSGAAAVIGGDTVTLTAGGADGDLGASGNALLTSGMAVVFTGTGTGDVNITEANGANVSGSTDDGAITLTTTTGSWTVSSTGVGTTGNVTITASAGDILQSGAADITGNTLTLSAGGADGNLGAGNALLTSGTTIVFTATGAGAVNITEANGANVSGSTDDGAITLISTTGSWTVNSTGVDTTGNVTVTATAGDILRSGVAADITGNVLTFTAGGADGDLGASGNALLTSGMAVVFTGTGTGDVFITESDGATITGATGSGAVTLTTTTEDWTINSTGVDTTGNVTITASAGDILQTGAADITGNTLTLSAAGKLGEMDDVLLTTGTTIVFASTDDVFITESNGATVSGTTGSGDVTLLSTTGSWTLNSTGVDTTGDVTITATAGDILRSGVAADITGTVLTLTAGGADGDLGASGNALLTSGAAIDFTGAGTGDVFITESDGATITGATGSGGVTLTTTTGDWTINSTGVDTTGNVTITASAGDILVSAAISSGSGNVTLNATGDIALAGAISTTSTVTLNADSEAGGTGAITYTSGSVNAGGVIATAAEGITLFTDATTLTATNRNSGTITVTEDDNLALNLLDNGARDIEIISTNGALTDNNGASNNIIAANLELSSATGITDIETDVTTLVATVSNGSISITENDALQITGAGVTTTGGNGNITLNVGGLLDIAGAISAGSGNVTLNATGDIALNETISTTGDATLTADSEAGGTGAITCPSGSINATDVIVMAAQGITISTEATTLTATNTASGAITVTEDDDIALNLLDNGARDIEITSTNGRITDNNDASNNIIAANLELSSATGITDIETNVTTLVATVSNGSISITEANALQIIGAGVTTGGNGSITLSAGGLLDIAGAISADGSGAVLLNSTGADTDILVGGAISSDSGNVTLNARGHIALNATIATTGDATLTADSEVGGTGAITYISGSINATDVIVTAAQGITISTEATTLTATNTTSGTITVTEDDDIALNLLNNGTRNIVLTSTSGAFTDNNAALNNILSASLTISAATGIDLDTTITTLTSAEVSGAGNIVINDLAGGLNVTTATTADGDITITATGGNLNVTLADASADLSLRTIASGDVSVGNVTAGVTATLVAVGEVRELAPTDAGADITAVDLTITAGTGIGTNSGGALETAITGTLTAQTTTGGVFVNNEGIFTIGNVAATTSGNITINGDANITVAGNVSTPDDVTITAVETDDDAGPYTNNMTVSGTVVGDVVTLRAGDDLTISSSGIVTSTGLMEVCAGYLDSDMSGALALDGRLNVGTGLTLCSSGDIVFGAPAVSQQPVINAPGLAVTLTTFNGNIYDDNDNGKPAGIITGPAFGGSIIDVLAAVLTLNAPNGYIGADDDTIETTVNSVTANAGNGGVYLHNTSALIVAAITAAGTGGTSIDITSQGNMTINGPVTDASGDDIDMTFFAAGATADLALNGTVTGSGNMTFNACDQVTIGVLGVISNTGTLDVTLAAGWPGADSSLPNNPLADLTISGALSLGNANLNLTAPNDVRLSGGSADITTTGRFTVTADRDGSAVGTGGAFRKEALDSTVQVGSVEITAADVVIGGTIYAGTGDIDVFASIDTSPIYINNTGVGLNLSLSDLLALRSVGGTISVGDDGHLGTVSIGGSGTVDLALVDANYTFNGGEIDFNGGISLHDDRTLTLKTGAVTPTGGSVTDVTIGGTAGTLVLNADGDVTLNTYVTNLGESSVDGDLILNNTNMDLTVTGDVVTATANINVGTGTFGVATGFTFASFNDTTGVMTITADGLALDGELSGGGDLTLRGNTVATTFGFGNGATGMFNLTLAEVDNILPGFEKIIIGRTAQTGAMHFLATLEGSVTFQDPVQIIGGTSTITIADGMLIGTDDASFDIDARSLVFEGADTGIETVSQAIDITASVTLSDDTLLDSGAAGPVSIIGAINGVHSLTITAGSGQVGLYGSPTPVPSGTGIGGTARLTTLTVTGGVVLLSSSVATTGDQTYTGTDIRLVKGNRSSSAGDLLFTGPVLVTSKTSNSAATGTIQFTGKVNSVPSGNGALTLTAGDVIFGGSVGDIEPLLRVVVNADNVTVGLPGDTFEAGALTLRANEVDFNGGPGKVSVTGLLDIGVTGSGTALRIGGAEGDNVGIAPTFNFSDDDIAALSDGIGSIILARLTGTQPIVIAEAGPVTFTDPVTIRQGQTKVAEIRLLGNLMGDTANGNITLKTTTYLDGTVSTTGGGSIDITNGIIADDFTLNTSVGGGDIFLRGNWAAVAGGENLTVNAGAGGITMTGAIGLSSARTPVLGAVTLTSGGFTTFGSSLSADSLLVNGGGTTKLGGSVTTIGEDGQVYANPVVLSNSAGLTSKHADGSIEFDSTIDSVAPKFNSLTITNRFAATGTDAVVVVTGNVGTVRLGTFRISTTGDAVVSGNIFAKGVGITAAEFSVKDVDTFLPLDTVVNAQAYIGAGTFRGAITAERLTVTTTADVINEAPWRVAGLATINTSKTGNIHLRNIDGGPLNRFDQLSARGNDIEIETEGDLSIKSLRAETSVVLTTFGVGDITQTGAISTPSLTATAFGEIVLTKSNAIRQFEGIRAGGAISLISNARGPINLNGVITTVTGDILLVSQVSSFIYSDSSALTPGSGKWTMYTSRLNYSADYNDTAGWFGSDAQEKGTYPTAPSAGDKVIIYRALGVL